MEHTVASVCAQFGLKPDTLRKWERRGLLPKPKRLPNGYRAYTADDRHRIEAFVARLRAGEKPAAAGKAAAVVAAPPRPRDARLEQAARAAAEALDRGALQSVFDAALAEHGLAGAFAKVWQPALAALGELGHRQGGLWIAREHFAVGALRALLCERARAPAGRPLLALAAPEGEWHELGLLAAWTALCARGVPTLYLGANLPAASLAGALRRERTRAVCLSLTCRMTRPAFAALAGGLRRRVPGLRLYIAGRAAAPLAASARRLGAGMLGEDLEPALRRLEEDLAGGRSSR
jgi:DNA-binding transcriptional MerR regulator